MNKNLINLIYGLFVSSILVVLTACGTLLSSVNKAIPQAQPTPTAPVAGENPSVTVNDQQYDGTSVIVADVFSQGPGWMVIHAQSNDNVGDAIGETQLQPGDNQNVVVKIDPSKATAVMYAMLHVDAGTVGKYEFPGPDVPVIINGEMLSPAFKAASQSASAITPTPDAGSMGMTTPSAGGGTPMVKVSDQALSGSTVTVDDVVSTGPGWVVIYTTDGYGQPGEPIGHAAVKDGDNPMVTVQVDPAKAQGTLYAQLHSDGGTVGTFEYPGADSPVMVGVQMIARHIQNPQRAASRGRWAGNTRRAAAVRHCLGPGCQGWNSYHSAGGQQWKLVAGHPQTESRWNHG